MNIINYTTREKMDANDYMFGERNGEMLKFKKSECNCMICGNKNIEGGNEEMNIVRDGGDNLISFSICRKCRIRFAYELDSHNRGWDRS